MAQFAVKTDERPESAAYEDTSYLNPLHETPGRFRSLLSLPKLVTIAADAVAIMTAMALAFALRRLIPGGPVHTGPAAHAVAASLSVPLWTALFARYRLYTARRLTSRLQEFEQVVHALIASVLATAALSFMLGLHVSRGWLILSFPLSLIAVQSEREVVRQTFVALRRRGRFLRRIIVVGANAEALELDTMLQRNPSLGYKIVGFVTVQADAQRITGIPLLGGVEDLHEALDQTSATGVLIATTAVDCATSNRLARQLTDLGIHVELSSSLRDIRAERLTVWSLGSFPVIYIEPVRRGGWRALAKRSFDALAAAIGLVVLFPILLTIAVLVKLDSLGPVLFRQIRIGKDGKSFQVFKFRTMVPDAERLLEQFQRLNDADGPLFKIRDDPRVTRIGRLLRRSSLDELPQLWNILRGEMSLVGPRPALPCEVQAWSPELHQRLRVKPGLTGMWQVNGRANASFEDYVRLDLYYVDNWSLWTDLAIVTKTVPTVLFRKGSY